MMKINLTIDLLRKEAKTFSKAESQHNEPALFGVTDGKAVGTYLEHKFQAYLRLRYEYGEGSSAKGIDFPELGVDMKVTSIKQPQSSCPFKSAKQKSFGLGYSLIVFVYEKTDDNKKRTGRLDINHTIFIEKHRTADFQTTSGLKKIFCQIVYRADRMVAPVFPMHNCKRRVTPNFPKKLNCEHSRLMKNIFLLHHPHYYYKIHYFDFLD